MYLDLVGHGQVQDGEALNLLLGEQAKLFAFGEGENRHLELSAGVLLNCDSGQLGIAN